MWAKGKRMRKNRRKPIRDKNRALWRRRLTRVLAVAAGLALVPLLGLTLVFGHDLLTQTRYFAIDRIEVLGTERLTAAQIRQKADVAAGMNLLAVNLDLVRKRLLAHPWVADAAVRRELPDRLRIWIQEHRPLAVVELDRPLLVDTAGRIFKVAGQGEAAGLPRITGLGYGDLPAGKTPAGPAFAGALALLRTGQRNFSGTVQRVRVDHETGLSLWTDAAAGPVGPVVMGYGDYASKFSRLSRVLATMAHRLPGRRLERIDLTDINRIVVTPQRGDPPVAGPKEV